MKVAIDGLLLGEFHTGVEISVEQLAVALAQPQVGVATSLLVTPAYAPRAKELGIQTLTAPGLASSRIGRIIFTQTLMTRYLTSRGCELLHAPAYVMPLNWRGPSVLTVYDLIALQFPQWCKPSNVAHYRLVLPRSLRKATRIIVPSHCTADAVTEMFPEVAPKLRIIQLGIGSQFQPVTDAKRREYVRRQYRLPERFLLCLGNIEPKKNLGAVVAAYEQIAADSDEDLVMAGAKTWKSENLAEIITASPVAHRIRRTGPIAAEDLPALYSMASLLIQWSLWEGVGLPPLEAMACGTAAIVSDGGALPELAGQAAQIVPLGPPEALAEAVLSLRRDRDRCEEIVVKGRQLAERWTWSNHAQRVVTLYEEVAGA